MAKPIDHFSKYRAGEVVMQVSLRKIDKMPFVEFKLDSMPQDAVPQYFAFTIINATLTAMLADATGKGKEYEQLFSQLQSLAGRKTTQFADEELK